jgi:hypothetical protein
VSGSHHVFFSFSTGLSKPMRVRKGLLAEAQRHVAEVEKALGLKAEQYMDNPPHWTRRKVGDRWLDATEPSTDISDEEYCRIAEEHSTWVRYLYDDLARWAKEPPADGEELTPEQAATFWHGLQQIKVPVGRWSGEYYKARAEAMYEIMRGRPSEGFQWGQRALTPKQAAGVIWLLAEYMGLDPDDMRLDVPNGYDYLASSADGGYTWCSKCGPAHPDDADRCRKKKCPVRAERGEDE